MQFALKHLLLAALLAVAGAAVHAADAIELKSLQFANDASSGTVTGSLKGRQTIDCKLRARAGQTVSLKTTTSANDFNVLPPGFRDVAFFVGSNDGNDWTGVLPASPTMARCTSRCRVEGAECSPSTATW